jgi:site-specific DNA recombinase
MSPDHQTKNCGLVVRVSTKRQAANDEGSLRNQLQRLRAHIEYKHTACGEDWREATRYVLKAVSGRDSYRSAEFAQLFEDIRTGKVNTVLCTALDRVSRSVLDFLNFFERLQQHNVEFVCLKQNYDTTTPQGRLFVTVMMALAQFEREQTAERTRDATLARAERGLWNGAMLLGYDPDPEKRGSLRPNRAEAAIVRLAFSHYLECGSILETARELNRRGYRTKRYQSRDGTFHEGRRFCYSTVQYMLKNMAYIGKKEINKKTPKRGDPASLPEELRYRVIDGVWPPIVEGKTFWAAQKLLEANNRTRTSGARKVRHNYVLNSGLLWCLMCGSEMEGRCGNGRKGVTYYYYACKNRECGFKLRADEIEAAVLERLGELARDEEILQAVTAETNAKLRKEVPNLRSQKRHLQRGLEQVEARAERILAEWADAEAGPGADLVRDKIDELGLRKAELEEGIVQVDEAIAEIEKDAVSQELVREALANISDVFHSLKPIQQKEMLRLVLHRARASDTEIELELYGKPPDIKARLEANAVWPQSRSETPKTLPRVDSNHQPFG